LLDAALADKDKPTFAAQVRLVAFVCTADKARCYRDVHNTALKHAGSKKSAK
jgi:hypothetical protein